MDGINHFVTLRLCAEKKVAYPAPGQDSAGQLLSEKGYTLQESYSIPVFPRFYSVAVPMSQNICWKSYRTGSKHATLRRRARRFPEERDRLCSISPSAG